MTTRRVLEQRVFTRLRDFGRQMANPVEVQLLLNDAQDLISGSSNVIRRFRSIPLVSGTSIYQVPDAPGVRVNTILNVQVNDGTYDLYPLQQVDLMVMAEEVPTWRTDTGVPTAYILGTDPSVTYESARITDTITTYPKIDLDGYSLKVVYAAVTDNQLRGDEMEPLLPVSFDEALVSYAVAEVLLRNLMLANADQAARFTALEQAYRARFQQGLDDAIALGANSFGTQYEIPARRF